MSEPRKPGRTKPIRSRMPLAEWPVSTEKPPIAPTWRTASHGLRCGVCDTEVELLTKAHVRKHGLTLSDYVALYPQHGNSALWGVLRRRFQAASATRA